jgi:hypothetical protein
MAKKQKNKEPEIKPLVAEDLKKAQRAAMTARLTIGSLKWAGVTAIVWLLLFGADNLLALPGSLRFPLAAVAVVWTIAALAVLVVRPLVKGQSLEQTALLLEQKYGTEHNLIINSLQLANGEHHGAGATFASKTIDDGASRVKSMPLGELWQLPRIAKIGILAALVLLGWGAYAHLHSDLLANAAIRFALPFSDTPPLGTVELAVDPGEDIMVIENDDLTVYAIVNKRNANDDSPVAPPNIVVRSGRKAVSPSRYGKRGAPMYLVTRQAMREAFSVRTGTEATEAAIAEHGTPAEKAILASDVTVFGHKLEAVKRPQAFRVFHDNGGTYTRNVFVDVHLAPRIKGSQFHITPPEYTGAETLSTLGPPHSVTGLASSKLQVELTFDHPVSHLVWAAAGEETAFVEVDGKWRAETELTGSGDYRVMLRDAKMKKALSAAAGSILLREDRHPQIDFISAARSRTVAPGSTLKLSIAASDDFGLKNAAVTVRSARGDGERTPIEDWTFGDAPGQADPFTAEFSITIDSSVFIPGQDYVLEAVCEDFHPEGHRGHSRPFVLKVTEVGADTDLLANEDNAQWLAELDKAIALQQKALSSSRTLIEFLPETLGQDESTTNTKYSFDRHHNKISENQIGANSAIASTRDLAKEVAPEISEELDSLRRVQCVQTADGISGLGSAKYWLAGLTPVKTGKLPQDSTSQKITWPAADGRFLAITGTGGGKPVDIADLEPLGRGALSMPGVYIRHWRLSPVVMEWKNWDKFIDMPDAKLQEITDKAASQKLIEAPDSYVSVARQLPNGQHEAKAHYLTTLLTTTRARKIRVFAGSSDSLRLWINGKPVIQALGLRPPRADQDIAIAELAEGKNTVVAEISHSKNVVGLYLRLEEMDGSPLGRAQYGVLTGVPRTKAVHSNSADTKHPLVNLTDGKSGSFWRSTANDNALAIVDFGQTLTLGGLYYHPASAERFADYAVYTFDELPAGKMLPPPLRTVEKRQAYILDQLIAMRSGQLGDMGETIADKGEEMSPEMQLALAEELVDGFLAAAEDYKDKIKETGDERRAIIKDSSDFSGEEEAALEAIKIREARLEQKLKQAVRDISVLGDLDYGDQSQSKAIQTFMTDAQDLSDKSEELTEERPNNDTENLESDVVGLVEELTKNGEMTFPEDVTKNELEQSEDETNAVPLVELPQELEDIVGEAEEAVQELDDEIADVGQSLVSLDVGEGPIMPGANSSNSAQGKTGNQQPENKTELEGRSGFGRTGMSNGSGVEDVAKKVDQNDQQTLARNTTSPLESGNVQDEDPGAAQNATGLGKSTDATTEFGMDGDLPPSLLNKMQETMQKQQEIKAKLDAVKMKLGAHNLPTKDIDAAIGAMVDMEAALKEGNAQRLKQAYSDSLRLTGEARRTIGRADGLDVMKGRLRARHSGRKHVAGRSAPPKGYEKMVGAFFEEIANDDVADTDD